jgi:hypothetical protein
MLPLSSGLLHLLWRWIAQVALKFWYLSTKLCCIISKETIVLIFTAIGITNLGYLDQLPWYMDLSWKAVAEWSEEFCLLWSSATQSIESQRTFRRKMSPPSSETKNKASKIPAWSRLLWEPQILQNVLNFSERCDHKVVRLPEIMKEACRMDSE